MKDKVGTSTLQKGNCVSHTRFPQCLNRVHGHGFCYVEIVAHEHNLY